MFDEIDRAIIQFLARYELEHPQKPFAEAWEVAAGAGLSREQALSRLQRLDRAGLLRKANHLIAYGYRLTDRKLAAV